MNVAERTTVYGLSKDGSFFVTLVRAETKQGAVVMAGKVAASHGLRVAGLNQATEQLPHAPGRWRVDVAVWP